MTELHTLKGMWNFMVCELYLERKWQYEQRAMYKNILDVTKTILRGNFLDLNY